MLRRFQFSLRALLGLSVAMCLLLGARHLLETCGQFVASQTARIGEPVAINGRLIRFFGPREYEYFLDVIPRVEGEEQMTWLGTSKRSWLCVYEVSQDFGPMSRPGSYRLILQAAERDAPKFRGDLIIEP